MQKVLLWLEGCVILGIISLFKPNFSHVRRFLHIALICGDCGVNCQLTASLANWRR